jgi:hypothetical protein
MTPFFLHTAKPLSALLSTCTVTFKPQIWYHVTLHKYLQPKRMIQIINHSLIYYCKGDANSVFLAENTCYSGNV